MNLINRGFISVKPSNLFIRWAHQYDKNLIFSKNAEATIYLIEEDFWDDEILIKKYANYIAFNEFNALGVLPSNWPKEFNLNSIAEWFDCQLGCTCIDLIDLPITKEAID